VKSAIHCRKLVSSIIALTKKDGSGVYWEGRSWERWSWQGGNTELTAHVLSALVDQGTAQPFPPRLCARFLKGHGQRLEFDQGNGDGDPRPVRVYRVAGRRA